MNSPSIPNFSMLLSISGTVLHHQNYHFVVMMLISMLSTTMSMDCSSSDDSMVRCLLHLPAIPVEKKEKNNNKESPMPKQMPIFLMRRRQKKNCAEI